MLPRVLRLGRQPASSTPNPVLLDEVFPLRLSAFQITEFNLLLRRLPGATALTTAHGLTALAARPEALA